MDSLSRKMDDFTQRHKNDQPTPQKDYVLEKEYCWEDLDYTGEYTLQRHVVTGECRIISPRGEIANGPRDRLEAQMRSLSALPRPAAPPVTKPDTPPVANPSTPPITKPNTPPVAKPAAPPVAQTAVTKPKPMQARCGDIIAVFKTDGSEQWGVYVSDTCVVRYGVSQSAGLFGGATIHATDLRAFVKGGKNPCVLNFPTPQESGNLAAELSKRYGYKLFEPRETVERARSRLGESGYHFGTGSGETFALWCKTDVGDPARAREMVRFLDSFAKRPFHIPLYISTGY